MPGKSPHTKPSGASIISGISASLHTEEENIYHKAKKAHRSGSDEGGGTDSKDEETHGPDLDWNIAVLERDDEGKYGWFGCRPRCLQCLCHPTALLISLALIAVAEGFFAHGVIPSIHTALHRRFHFSMQQLGLIRMMYDVGMVVAFLPVMHFNARGANRAWWLGIGSIVTAVGAFVCVLPHFIHGEYYGIYGHGNKSLCHLNGSAKIVNASGLEMGFVGPEVRNPAAPCPFSDLSWTRYVFMLGLFLNGAGAAPYFTMGIAYLDENVPHRSSMLYSGLLNVMLLVGVLFGFVFSAVTLAKWVDITHGVPDSFMVPDHPHWVGAWWFGPVLAAVLSVLTALPILGFPKRLPGATRVRMQEAIKDAKQSDDHDPKATAARSVWQSLKSCAKNIPYLGLVLEQCAFLMVVTSFVTFLPAYLRAGYGTNAIEARISAGAVVLAALIGAACGTWLQHRFRFSVTTNLRFALATAVATLIFLGAMLIECTEAEFAGATKPYPVQGENTISLVASCNRHCANCSRDFNSPGCYVGPRRDDLSGGRVMFVYYSPCFAGCLRVTDDRSYDCKCVPKGKANSQNGNGKFSWEGGGTLLQGKACESSCIDKGRAFLVGMVWCAAMIFARLNPMQYSLLRCIPFKDRVVGLVLCAVVSRLLAAIPAPPLMGLIMSRSCSVWRTRCGVPTSCAWRDQNYLIITVGVCAYGFCILGTLGLAIATFTYKEKKVQSLKRVKRVKHSRQRRASSNSGSMSPNRGSDSGE